MTLAGLKQNYPALFDSGIFIRGKKLLNANDEFSPSGPIATQE
jgi:hypothetical protein